MIGATKVEPTKAEQLIASIVFKARLARECREQEQRASSVRNGYECEASNAVIALAKELVDSLGSHAAHLAAELGAILGWDRVRGLAPAKTKDIQNAPGSSALCVDPAVAPPQKGAQGPACEPSDASGGGGGSRVPPGG